MYQQNIDQRGGQRDEWRYTGQGEGVCLPFWPQNKMTTEIKRREWKKKEGMIIKRRREHIWDENSRQRNEKAMKAGGALKMTYAVINPRLPSEVCVCCDHHQNPLLDSLWSRSIFVTVSEMLCLQERDVFSSNPSCQVVNV